MSQYKYAEIGDDVFFWFAANQTDGDAGDGATPLFDVRLAGAAAGAIPTASGTPTLLSHANYGAGLHEILVDTDGYAAGEYAVFCTLTISTVNPGGFVGSFLLRTAGDPVLDVNTIQVKGVPVANTAVGGYFPADVYYYAGEVATTSAGNKPDVNVQEISDDSNAAANLELFFDGTGYDAANSTVGTVTAVTSVSADGITSTSMAADSINAAALKTDALDAIADVVWDELLTGATHNINNSAGKRLRQIQENLGYELGAVWIDTVNGTAGTTNFENGTVGNPVDSIADARTIADSLGLKIFHLSSDSSITLAQEFDDFEFQGDHWDLALGSQSISGTAINGANVTGIATGASKPHFTDCEIGTSTLPSCHFHKCAIEGSITLSSAGDYIWDHCYSAIAGTATPDVDFGAAVANTNLNMRHHSGGIEIKNMGGTGTDNMSLEGEGQLIINANCDPSNSPVIAIRGHFTITDNVVGGFVAGGGTLSIEANYVESTLVDATIIDVLAMTGVTVGGTKTFAEWCAIVGAGVAGDVSLAAGTSTYKDIDDGSSVFTTVLATTGTIKDVTIT